MTSVLEISPTNWLTHAAEIHTSGFVTLMAVDRPGTKVIEIWLRTADGCEAKCTIARDNSEQMQSLVSVWPDALWREREIHEMFGLEFSNPQSNQPLLFPASSPFYEKYPLRRDVLLKSRNETSWPGGKDPADATKSPSRRKSSPAGVDPEWTQDRGDAL